MKGFKQSPSPEEQFKQFMKFLDQDGDGQISLSEILQAFQAIDTSKDGALLPDDFQKFINQLEKKNKEQCES